MEGLEGVVRRNTFLLGAAMALNWAVIVLLAALTSLTIAHLFGLPELAGLGWGIFLLAYAAGGLVVGRLMDAWGRRDSLIAAFLVGAAGAGIVYVGVSGLSMPLAFGGLLICGVGTGGANLARVAGADMYPPKRRPRGIALVLFGAAWGALGAPIVFAPVLAGARTTEPAALAAPWPIAAALLLGGAAVLLAIRVDPRTVAERLHLPLATEPPPGPPGSAVPEPSGSVPGPPGSVAEHSGFGEDVAGRPVEPTHSQSAPAPAGPGRSLAELFRLPMVPLALLAAIVAQAVMTATMALAGLIMADHGHDLGAVSVTISVHFLGMFGLVLVVGPLVERIGRFRSVLLGLVLLAGGVVVLLPAVEMVNFLPGMFAVGLGWNFAFVASTAILADAARAGERGRLLGASDFLALIGAAVLSVVAGLILDTVGLTALVVVGALLSLVPALLIGLNRRRLGTVPA